MGLGALAAGWSWRAAFAVMGLAPLAGRALLTSAGGRRGAAPRRAPAPVWPPGRPLRPRASPQSHARGRVCSGNRPPSRLAASQMARFMERARLLRLPGAVALVGGGPRRASGAAIWDWFELGPRPETRAGPRRDAGRGVVSGRRGELHRAGVQRGAPGSAGDRARVGVPGRRRRSPGTSCADQVARCAAGLRRLGVGRGDRVAAYMPNTPETVVAFLATASIGAVWSSCAPEFGTPTVVDRFKQIEPKVLIAIEGYRYGGKDFDRRERVARDRGGDPLDRAHGDGPQRLGRPAGSRGRISHSSRCRSTTRSGCSTRRAPPACPRRSCRARAASCSST